MATETMTVRLSLVTKLDGIEVEMDALTYMISLAFETYGGGWVIVIIKTEKLIFAEFY